MTRRAAPERADSPPSLVSGIGRQAMLLGCSQYHKIVISFVLNFLRLKEVAMSNKSLTLKNVCNELAGKLLAEKDPAKSHELSDNLRRKMKELDAVIRGEFSPSRAAHPHLKQRRAS
jgi:hypothetical protein